MPPTADSSPPPRGLIVVTVDRLPAWILAAWGATWVATPALDALAARGLLFDRLLTPTLDPAVNARAMLSAADGGSVLQAATARGWRVAVVTDQPAITEAVDLGRDATVTVVEASCPRAVAVNDARTNLGRLFDAAAATLAAGRHEVVWCHAGSLGIAWDAPDAYREAYIDPDDPPPPPGAGVPNMAVDAATDPDLLVGLRHVFAGQLTLLDGCVGRLLAAADARRADGDRDDAGWLVLVAGLRGMPLGIHDWMGGGAGPDQRLPFSESIHVPAILVDPAGRMAGQRYGGLVIPADVGATIGELMGETAGHSTRGDEDAWEGRSLVSLLAEWRVEPRDRVVASGTEAAALVTAGWHLITSEHGADAPRKMLFAKPDDFFERSDVSNRCPDVAEELARILATAQAGDPRAAWRMPLSAAASACG